MSSTHLLGNKLVSSEKPGWVAATAEAGSVKAVSTRGRGQGERGPGFPLQLPDREGGSCVLPLDLEAAGCQLPTPACRVHTTSGQCSAC